MNDKTRTYWIIVPDKETADRMEVALSLVGLMFVPAYPSNKDPRTFRVEAIPDKARNIAAEAMICLV